MIKTLTIVILVMLGSSVYAVDNKHFELAMKFEKLSSARDKASLVDKLFPTIKQYADPKSTNKHDSEIKKYLVEVLQSKEYTNGKVKVYMDLYSEEELIILIKLVQSSGYKLLNKQRTNISVGLVKNMQQVIQNTMPIFLNSVKNK